MVTFTDDPDLQMILADMRGEFVVNAEDKLRDVQSAIDDLDAGRGVRENHLLEIKRLMHSIKGGAGSVGFPTVTKVAHAMEDYLEASEDLASIPASDLQVYVDTVSSILDTGREPDESLAHMMLRSLPTARNRDGGRSLDRGSVMLVMPQGVQRKIISRELSQAGFKVNMVKEPLAAIDMALTLKPDIAVITRELERISGPELASVLAAIEGTRQIRVGIVTSAPTAETKLVFLANNAVWLHKGPTFGSELMKMISEATRR